MPVEARIRREATCPRCRRTFHPVLTGKIRSHECPHGMICRPPMKTRTRGEPCPLCFEARQLTIFDRLGRSTG
jgi:hypothetical protein